VGGFGVFRALLTGGGEVILWSGREIMTIQINPTLGDGIIPSMGS